MSQKPSYHACAGGPKQYGGNPSSGGKRGSHSSKHGRSGGGKGMNKSDCQGGQSVCTATSYKTCPRGAHGSCGPSGACQASAGCIPNPSGNGNGNCGIYVPCGGHCSGGRGSAGSSRCSVSRATGGGGSSGQSQHGSYGNGGCGGSGKTHVKTYQHTTQTSSGMRCPTTSRPSGCGRGRGRGRGKI